jgi:hypothetical protein
VRVLRVHGQSLFDLREQQAVFAVLQNCERQRCFQHALQGGFIPAKWQCQVAGIHHQLGHRVAIC